MTIESKMRRHPLAIAWDEWLASEEGQQARSPHFALAREGPYLENRLHRAFDAGAKAATPADAEQLVRLREAATDALNPLEYLLRHTLIPEEFVGPTEQVVHALRNALGTQREEANNVE